MLNTTNIRFGSNSQEVNFNAPSTGMMQRSNPNSIFIRFQLGSELEKMLFPRDNNKPFIKQFHWRDDKSDYNLYEKTKGKIEVVILQILIFGDNQYLCEVIENRYLESAEKE